ncbi:MAG: flagellar biosynthesis regulator FlaF [Rhodobacteraceae bacterium]|nr:flagellar biosynthesis regulator FlaF [Paracoccaceae bacterium]
MNTAVMAKSLYGKPTQEVGTKRGIEYKAFSKATARLAEFTGTDSDDFAGLAEALCENQLLWTVLAADVAGDGNGLPEQLRAQIFYLTQFTNHHTKLVLNHKASPDILVEINTSIMRGLRDCATGPELVTS